jgi:predicted RNase H-related nuclease YkuK (DUF458 family)
MHNRQITPEQIKEFLDLYGPDTRVYLGCDSTTTRKGGKWVATFYSVVVIHMNGCNGCKIFGEISREADYNYDKKKPRFRLMQEVYKVTELYLRLFDVIGDHHVEVHLDLNPDERHVSNIVIQEAIGYIKGTCNVVPMVKPDAFAASYAADRLGRVPDITKANRLQDHTRKARQHAARRTG